MRLSRLNQLILANETVDGVWRLTRGHQLEYRKRGAGQEAVLTGALIAAEPDALVFRVAQREDGGGVVNQLFSLRGRWEADSRNRLNFLVEREKGRFDRLVFQGGWEVTEDHEILYRYKLPFLGRSRFAESALIFRGQWDFSADRRLVYLLDLSGDSVFRFRGAFQTSSVLAKEGQVRYQVGVEVEGKMRVQTVTFFGKWKLSRDLAVEFELASAGKRKQAILFGASWNVVRSGAVSARLTVRKGQPIGLEVIFSREFLRNGGQAFMSFRKFLEETVLEAGVLVRW